MAARGLCPVLMTEKAVFLAAGPYFRDSSVWASGTPSESSVGGLEPFAATYTWKEEFPWTGVEVGLRGRH